MTNVPPAIPQLTGDALRAVKHRGSHLQIIASAGSGKTEVVSQRVADLFADGVDPRAVVAFTFTERAAESLKSRIEQRTEARLDKSFLDKLNGCFIGTIHAYCFRLLQEHVPLYETFDVLDEHRLAAFLTREAEPIGLKGLSPNGRLFEAIQTFQENMDVVDNELLSLDQLQQPFKGTVERFWRRLEEFHFVTYGQIIARAVAELRRPQVFRAVHGALCHLIVDEYQDINPAQEALIQRLAEPPVELCVVGDDDQSIYQWRGSDVSNIVTFAQRYPNVATFNVEVNRRSRPQIIAAANAFGAKIKGRLPKTMLPNREPGGTEVVTWLEPTEAEEADLIARSILRIRRQGYRFRDMAVLVRSSTSYNKLLDAFEGHAIPVLPAGRTGLFLEPDAQRFGRTFAYLADTTWRSTPYGNGSKVSLNDLVRDYASGYGLDATAAHRAQERLRAWRQDASSTEKAADLIGNYYQLLSECGLARWDLSDPLLAARMGAHARCSAILADYESVRRRPRRDPAAPGEVLSGQAGGPYYYFGLAIHIQNITLGAFKGFEGVEDVTLDAVDVTTVHQAKGLEWPVVFVPCVSQIRFPSSNTGKARNWHVPQGYFNRIRYEGTVNDERRLFYVAMTERATGSRFPLTGHRTSSRSRRHHSSSSWREGGQVN